MAPDPWSSLGRLLLSLGVLLILLGGTFLLVGHMPGISHLPGDIHYQKGNFSCFFPLVSMLLLSALLTLLLNLIIRLWHR